MSSKDEAPRGRAIEDAPRPFECIENDPSVVRRIVEVVEAIKDSDNSGPLFGELYDLFRRLVLPIDQVLVEIGYFELVRFVLEEVPFTPVVQVTMLSLLAIYKLSPVLPVRFCAENPGLFTRFVRAPDLLMPACTMILLSLKAGPEFVWRLVTECNAVEKLGVLAESVWDQRTLSLLATLISQVLIRVDLSELPEERAGSILASLKPMVHRFFTGDFQKPSLAYSFLRRDVMVPVLNILDVMILKYQVEIDSLVSLDVMNKLWFILDNPRDERYGDPECDVYKECLKVWNRIIQVFGCREDEEENLERLAFALLNQFKMDDLPRMHIMFVLSNIMAFERVVGRIVETGGLWEIMSEIYAHFNEFTIHEKENVNIMFLHVLQFQCPLMVMNVLNFSDWLVEVLDEVESQTSDLYALHMMSALQSFLAWNSGRPDGERLDTTMIRETIEALRLSTNPDTEVMATDILRTYFSS